MKEFTINFVVKYGIIFKHAPTGQELSFANSTKRTLKASIYTQAAYIT